MTAIVAPLDQEADQVDSDHDIVRAGLPVIQRLAEDLGHMTIRIVLTDAHANVVAEVVGAAASASNEGGTYVEAPIEDPRRDVAAASIGVTCAVSDAGPLMLPYLQLAARTIADRMVDSAAVAHRALLEQFLRARRRARGPIVAVNERDLLTNGAATHLVQPDDRARIWSWAIATLAAPASPSPALPMQTGAFAVRFDPVFIGDAMVGAIVYFKKEVPRSIRPDRSTGAKGLSSPGWDSLLASERGIAQLVAEGLTNREVAARIHVSRHTVDFHLRQIYRKLTITSRIELTRLVVQRAAAPNADRRDRVVIAMHQHTSRDYALAG